MKKIITLLSILVSVVAYAQLPSPTGTRSSFQPLGNPYLDADYLIAQIHQQEYKEIIRIINFYSDTHQNSTDTTVLAKTIRENSFLHILLGPHLTEIKTYLFNSGIEFKKHMMTAPEAGVPVTGGSPLMLFSATRVADGLGTFIAERFKEELTQRYLQAFRDSIIMNDEKYHYSTLLPQTYSALLQYENVFDYKSFMTALKEAFKDDLDNLAPNSLLFLNQLKTNGAIKIPDDQFYLLYYLADFVVNKIPEGQSPSALLFSIDQYEHKDKLNQDVLGYIRTTSLVASNLVNNLGEVEPEKINELLFNRQRVLAFAGLTIAKEREKLQHIILKQQNAYQFLNSGSLENISYIIGIVNDLRTALRQFNASKKEAADVVKLSVKVSPTIRKLISHFHVMPEEDITKTFLALAHIINIADFSSEQKYGLIITEALSLFDDAGLSQTPFFLTFKKYGLFISNVAQAETSQQVKEALDVAALPVGSYKIKRNSFFDISLNAYPGLAAGVEFRSGIPAGASVERVNPTLAFSVPVGLGFSWGVVKEKQREEKDSTLNQNEFSELKNGKWVDKYIAGRSHSVFFSVLDIGAITSFRLIDDDTESLPEFNWNNILAPGIYYVNGLKNTPISWGVGIQYGPQLRGIEQNGTSLKLTDSLFSARIFFAVDVPVFSFYTRNTLKKK